MSTETTHRIDSRPGGAGLPADRQAIDILLDLVRTPSVSGSERAAAEVFVRWARELGLGAEIDEAGSAVAWRSTAASKVARLSQPCGAVGGGERFVQQSDEDARLRQPCHQIMLLGHIDTVPGEIPVRIEDGVLHGRGSVDAKGPLAAMLVAAARADLPPDTTVIVAGAVGEETPRSTGALHLAATYHPDACIIGEPSGADGVTLGYKGRVLAHAVRTADSAHAAGPEGSSADVLIEWWSRVLALAAERNAGVTAEFDRLQCTIRSMGSRQDGMSDSARLTAGFRLPPGLDPNELTSQLREVADETITLAFEGHEIAHRTGRNDPVVRAISNAIRAGGATPRPKLKTGTSDLNVVAPIWRCPIAAYGPGDSTLDHTPRERLVLDEYLEAITVLTRAIPALATELAAPRTEPQRTPISLTA